MLRRVASFHLLRLIVFIALLQACTTQKKLDSILYFNQQGDSTLAKLVQNTEPVIQPGDRLSIVVNALDPASVAPYNLTAAAAGAAGTGAGGYIVEEDGTIQFPQLGKMKVVGLKRKELIDLLTKTLVKFVNDPVVTIQFLN
ncbi:MAG TPA: polysaccharide biosynthesis/export family protein, partial [Segetibacter sp.]